MSQHTPGPWQSDFSARHTVSYVISAHGAIIAEITISSPTADEVRIAANAALIAAAPDLFEALRRIRQVIEPETIQAGGESLLPGILQEIDAIADEAIAKTEATR